MSENYDNCFVCGAKNPIGLKLCFAYDAAGHAFAELRLSELFEGYPAVVHGGILSTLLDEVMAKAVIQSGKIAFTARLEISYRKALAPGALVQLEGWITQSKSRTIRTAAKIHDANGVYAEAEAIFVVPQS